MDTGQVIKLLCEKQGNRSLREYAKEIDCSVAYLSDVILGNRNPGPKILKFLNIQRTKTVTIAYTVAKKKK